MCMSLEYAFRWTKAETWPILPEIQILPQKTSITVKF